MVEEISFSEGIAAIRNEKFEKRVYGLLDRMKKKIGVKIPKKEYPLIFISKKNTGSFYGEKNQDPLIVISLDNLHSGTVIGEEISHFIRDYLIGKKEDYKHHPSEFFGYLGYKILQSIAKPRDELEFEDKLKTRKDELKRLRRVKRDLKDWRKYEKGELKGPDITPEKIEKEIKDILEYREERLTHWRAYDFASKVDLDKVELSELYSLPNKEVRKKFFRENPEYDSPQQSIFHRMGKRMRKGIENLLSILIVPVAIITILLTINMKFTGRVIGISENNNLISIFATGLLILSVLIIYLKFLSNKKNNRTN